MVARFSAPVQTGPATHSASYIMGTGTLSRGVKRPMRGVDHPPTCSAEVKERVEIYLYSHSGFSWAVLGWTVPLNQASLKINIMFVSTVFNSRI